jgi:hypothetical protein
MGTEKEQEKKKKTNKQEQRQRKIRKKQINELWNTYNNWNFVWWIFIFDQPQLVFKFIHISKGSHTEAASVQNSSIRKNQQQQQIKHYKHKN